MVQITTIPRYRDLPISDKYPEGSAWGVFGESDQVGTLNWQTSEGVVSAARLVQDGTVFPLNWDMRLPNPPVLGRKPMDYRHIPLHGGYDDVYDSYNPQASSQWDGLLHVIHPVHGLYNGFEVDVKRPTSHLDLGIDRWAQRGIVGRYVLADIAGYYNQKKHAYSPADRIAVTAIDLETVLAAQGTELNAGDVLLVNLGWIPWYSNLSDSARQRLARSEQFNAPGLSPEQSTAEWLWDHRVSAVATDAPSIDAMPFDKRHEASFLHYRLVPLLGMALGELFDLRALTDDSKQDGRYDGLFVAAPMNQKGGVSSAANAIAIK